MPHLLIIHDVYSWIRALVYPFCIRMNLDVHLVLIFLNYIPSWMYADRANTNKKKKRDAGQTFSPSFSLSTSLDSSFLSLFFYFSPFRFAFDWLSDRLSVGVRSYSSIRLYAAWNTSSLSYPSPVCYLTLWRDSEGEVEGSSSARCEKKNGDRHKLLLSLIYYNTFSAWCALTGRPWNEMFATSSIFYLFLKKSRRLFLPQWLSPPKLDVECWSNFFFVFPSRYLYSFKDHWIGI